MSYIPYGKCINGKCAFHNKIVFGSLDSCDDFLSKRDYKEWKKVQELLYEVCVLWRRNFDLKLATPIDPDLSLVSDEILKKMERKKEVNKMERESIIKLAELTFRSEADRLIWEKENNAKLPGKPSLELAKEIAEKEGNAKDFCQIYSELVLEISKLTLEDIASKDIMEYVKEHDGHITKMDVLRDIGEHREKTIFAQINKLISNGSLEEVQVEKYSTKRLKVVEHS